MSENWLNFLSPRKNDCDWICTLALVRKVTLNTLIFFENVMLGNEILLLMRGRENERKAFSFYIFLHAWKYVCLLFSVHSTTATEVM